MKLYKVSFLEYVGPKLYSPDPQSIYCQAESEMEARTLAHDHYDAHKPGPEWMMTIRRVTISEGE